MTTIRKALVIDDDEDVLRLCEVSLRMFTEWNVAIAQSADAAISVARRESPDVILLDVMMPGNDELAILRSLKASVETARIPVVLMTAIGKVGRQQLLEGGAVGLIPKPFDPNTLSDEILQILAQRATRQDASIPSSSGGALVGAPQILGVSPVMRDLKALVARAAASDASVLITGESGTGKELVARALHHGGARCGQPFVALNCTAVPEGLLESELFGHARGAFTDAKTSRAGLFEQANGGTLFLDEIGDMPLSLQPKLLRVLQERSVRPLGSTSEISLDVRVIAATNDDINGAIAARRFRKDLYYRIAVLQIDVPPLRMRGRDIELLARHFVESYAERAGKRAETFSSEMVERLVAHSWPGNVRELQNCMERVVALSDCGAIDTDNLTFSTDPTQSLQTNASTESLLSLAEVERLHILRVFDAVGQNRQRAARILGLDRRTLYRRLEQYRDAHSSLVLRDKE